MKRIAFYKNKFRLCEWSEEPKIESPQSKSDYSIISFEARESAAKERYKIAITFAMENGVVFSDQEKAKHYIFMNCLKDRGGISVSHVWQPKEGDNWPAPEEAEIVWDDPCKEECGETKGFIGTEHEGTDVCEDGCVWSKRVAVLKSESVKDHLSNNLNGKDKAIEELKKKYGIATSQRNRIRDRIKVSIPRIISIIEDGKCDRAVKELLDLLDVVKKDKKLYESKSVEKKEWKRDGFSITNGLIALSGKIVDCERLPTIEEFQSIVAKLNA